MALPLWQVDSVKHLTGATFGSDLVVLHRDSRLTMVAILETTFVDTSPQAPNLGRVATTRRPGKAGRSAVGKLNLSG
jgi:hypothetical protein